MKRVILGAGIAFTMLACGSAEETETSAVEETVNTEDVQALESATDKLENGLIDLENELNEVSSDVDSLLNSI